MLRRVAIMTSNKYSAQIIQRNKSWQACFQCVRSMLLLAPPARMVWGSLNANSVATLVHTFVTLHVDYSNAILAGASKSITDKLQWVLNAAAHTASDTHKYDRGLSHLLHEELHWLDVTQRAQYKCAQMSTDVCSPELHSTWRNAAFRSPTLPVGSVSGLPATTSCSYLDTGVQCSVTRPSLWLAWRPWTCYLTLFMTQQVHLTVSSVI